MLVVSTLYGFFQNVHAYRAMEVFVNNILEATVFVSFVHSFFQSTQSQAYHVQSETELFLINSEVVDIVIRVFKSGDVNVSLSFSRVLFKFKTKKAHGQSHDYQLIQQQTIFGHERLNGKILFQTQLTQLISSARNFDSPFSLHNSCFVLFARQIARNIS